MIDEKEFNVLKKLKSKSVLSRDDYHSDDEFDLVCEIIRDLLSKGIIHTDSPKPFLINRRTTGGHYLGAGRFNLSAIGMKIAQLETFEELKKSIPTKSQWTIDRRLTFLGLLIGLVGLLISILI